MRRVAIVGCPGSGKSTLARAMGESLTLPVIHMDVLYFQPGWSPSDDRAMRQATDAMALRDSWICDSTYIAASAVRFTRSDTVVWLRLPRTVSMRRAIWRAIRDRNRPRPDLPPGCREKIDLRFYAGIWNWNRDVRPRLTAAIQRLGNETRLVVLENGAEVGAFLATLKARPY